MWIVLFGFGLFLGNELCGVIMTSPNSTWNDIQMYFFIFYVLIVTHSISNGCLTCIVDLLEYEINYNYNGYSTSCDTLHWMIWKAVLYKHYKVAHYT
jgi:hypothetical protein